MAWTDILISVRELSLRGAITSETLSEATGLPLKVASAWLAKLTKWGYLSRSGSVPGPRRWMRIYDLTEWGRKYDKDYTAKHKRRFKVAGNQKKEDEKE